MKIAAQKKEPGEDRRNTSVRFKGKVLDYYQEKADQASKASGRTISRNELMERVLEDAMDDPNRKIEI